MAAALRQKKSGFGYTGAHGTNYYGMQEIRWKPYFAWANRGEGEMEVRTRID